MSYSYRYLPSTGALDVAVADGATITISGESTDTNVIIEGDGYITGNFGIAGKLTVDGLIDPTGMVFDIQSSVPGGNPDPGKATLWIRESDGYAVITDEYGNEIVLNGGGGEGSITQILVTADGVSATDTITVSNDTGPITTIDIPNIKISATDNQVIIGDGTPSLSSLNGAGAISNVFIGDSVGNTNIGIGNVLIGYQAGANSTDGTNAFNTFIGYQAGLNSTGADSCTYIGSGAGSSAANAYNTVVGQGSGTNISGGNNSIFGRATGGFLTSGDYNVIIGSDSLNTTGGGSDTTVISGDNNVMIGRVFNSTGSGSNNVLINAERPASNTSDYVSIRDYLIADNRAGVRNVVLAPGGPGSAAGSNVLIGCGIAPGLIAGANVVIGDAAGPLMAGNAACTIVGQSAAAALTTGGGFNAIFGYGAASTLTTGTSNIIIGAAAPTLTTGSTNILIGPDANVAASSTSDFFSVNGLLTGNFSSEKIAIGAGNSNTLLAGLPQKFQVYGDGYISEDLVVSDKFQVTSTEVFVTGESGERLQLATTEISSGAVTSSGGTLTLALPAITDGQSVTYNIKVKTNTSGTRDFYRGVVMAYRSTTTTIHADIAVIDFNETNYTLVASESSNIITLTFTNNTGTATTNTVITASIETENNA